MVITQTTKEKAESAKIFIQGIYNKLSQEEKLKKEGGIEFKLSLGET